MGHPVGNVSKWRIVRVMPEMADIVGLQEMSQDGGYCRYAGNISRWRICRYVGNVSRLRILQVIFENGGDGMKVMPHHGKNYEIIKMADIVGKVGCGYAVRMKNVGWNCFL